MTRRQTPKGRLQTCDNCERERRDVEKVSERIMPGGGKLCGECVVPTMMKNRASSGT